MALAGRRGTPYNTDARHALRVHGSDTAASGDAGTLTRRYAGALCPPPVAVVAVAVVVEAAAGGGDPPPSVTATAPVFLAASLSAFFASFFSSFFDGPASDSDDILKREVCEQLPNHHKVQKCQGQTPFPASTHTHIFDYLSTVLRIYLSLGRVYVGTDSSRVDTIVDTQ